MTRPIPIDWNDQTASVAELRQHVRRFIEERDWDQFHPPKDLAIGLITEASELLEHFRFRSEAEIEQLLQDDDFKEGVWHELADCLFFVLALSHTLEIDLSRSLVDKLAVSAQRYPVSQARGRNIKYTQLSSEKVD